MKVTGEAIFPYKLYDMLEESESQGYEEIVSWLSDGKGFQVHDVEKFVAVILPLYFGNQTHFRSFQRQLNFYLFERCKTSGSYSHPKLRRGNRNICNRIVRPQRKNSGQFKQSSKSRPSFPSLIIQPPYREDHQVLASETKQHNTSMDVGCDGILSYVSLESSATKDRSEEVLSFDETSIDTIEQQVSSGSPLHPKHHLSLVNSARRKVEIEPMPYDFDDINNEIILTFQGVKNDGLF